MHRNYNFNRSLCLKYFDRIIIFEAVKMSKETPEYTVNESNWKDYKQNFSKSYLPDEETAK